MGLEIQPDVSEENGVIQRSAHRMAVTVCLVDLCERTGFIIACTSKRNHRHHRPMWQGSTLLTPEEQRKQKVQNMVPQEKPRSYSSTENLNGRSERRRMQNEIPTTCAQSLRAIISACRLSQESQSMQNSAQKETGELSPSPLSMVNIPMLMVGNGSSESLNAIRNHQYLAQLAHHQSELAQYNSKQMEYLDQQRRYQQAMIDHQAGASLLMQKQQQEVNEQLRQLKQSNGSSESLGADNNVGGRILVETARGVKTQRTIVPNRSFSDDEVITSDKHLREYFTEKYGIDLSTEASELTAGERGTLLALKKTLVKSKDTAVNRGVFKTMDELKRKAKYSNTPRSSKTTSRLTLSRGCIRCISHDLKMMEGEWTQMYGNPHVIRKLFGTIRSLQNAVTANANTSIISKTTSCIGFELGPYVKGSAELSMFYRDDPEDTELHEMHGNVSSVENNIFIVNTEKFHREMCLVRTSPWDSGRYEYVIFAETSGKNSCRSYHIFARNTDEFNRRYFDDVSNFMKKKPCYQDATDLRGNRYAEESQRRTATQAVAPVMKRL
ncbi:hypothetical protein RB195_025154 [Necator americanus]|uniref:Uncharacterized protein n=1 Tax=Necator americanus TaxID=51031 RepID=A0ABR1ETA4_NECAM